MPEFLRFGSSIPGGYWGCCAADIIQNFKQDPDEKASIELLSGDGGGSLGKFAGPTWRDIFWQRLRYGTFGAGDMPNHAFFAILARSQLNSTIGKAWLKILHEAGFEFVRTVNNSVWNVDNYIFMLVRNVGPNAKDDQFTPPKEWLDLGDSPVPQPVDWLADGTGDEGVSAAKTLTAAIKKAQTPLYEALPKNQFLTEDEVVKAGAPVIYAGKRSMYPQQKKEDREKVKANDKNYTPQQPLSAITGGATNTGA